MEKIRCWLARDAEGTPHIAMCVPNEITGWRTLADYVLAFNPGFSRYGRLGCVEELKRTGWTIRPAEVSDVLVDEPADRERAHALIR
jgi:hypothetical protein